MLCEYRPRVLLVNDDAASLLALHTVLEPSAGAERYDVIVASSGEEALRQVLLQEFAVILMDVNMPGMDGFETADAIHAHPRTADTPIIFVTAFQADEVAKLRAYQYHTADFLFTPLVPQILRAKVSVFISLALKNEELRAQAEMLGRQTEELLTSNALLNAEILEREAAERDSDARDEFLAMLSHELRNPLSALTSAATLLGVQNLPVQVLERARNVMQRQTKQLCRIVDEILDLSRLTSGKIVLSCAPLDFADIVRDCVDALKLAGHSKANSIALDLASSSVMGDRARLSQVATHLISNALNFTPANGEICVSMHVVDDHVVLRVRDSGIGLDPVLLPRIFDVFVQGPQELHRSEGGLGIGLAVVKALVDLHGGNVSAFSDGLGKGSTFEVQLASCPPLSATGGQNRFSSTLQ